MPGVESAAGVRYMRPEYNGTVLFLTAIDVDQFVGPSQARGAGRAAANSTQFRELAGPDGVLVSDNFARRHEVDVGDTVDRSPGPTRPGDAARPRHRHGLLVEPGHPVHRPRGVRPPVRRQPDRHRPRVLTQATTARRRRRGG